MAVLAGTCVIKKGEEEEEEDKKEDMKGPYAWASEPLPRPRHTSVEIRNRLEINYSARFGGAA